MNYFSSPNDATQKHSRLMRTIQIKIWPEIIGQFPAVISNERIAKTKENDFVLDLSNLLKVDSTGLTMLLLNLIKLVDSVKDKKWQIIYPNDINIDSLIRKMQLYKLLVTKVPNENLFWQKELEQEKIIEPYIINMDAEIKMFPIYEISLYQNLNPRVEVDKFKEYLISQLYFLQENYDFELNVFIQMLVEMAKNSADHTNDNAYFGLDLIETKNIIKLQFAFGDLGIGVNQSVRDFIKEDNKFNNKEKHLALTDAYHYALQIGNTTKTNILNKGIGMASIYSLSKQINMNLSVYDATSRGLLSSAKNTTHTELRKVFYSLGSKVGFYYYGETEIYKS